MSSGEHWGYNNGSYTPRRTPGEIIALLGNLGFANASEAGENYKLQPKEKQIWVRIGYLRLPQAEFLAELTRRQNKEGRYKGISDDQLRRIAALNDEQLRTVLGGGNLTPQQKRPLESLLSAQQGR